MCKIHRLHCSINILKNSIDKITELTVIFKKIAKCNCMRFFFCPVYIHCKTTMFVMDFYLWAAIPECSSIKTFKSMFMYAICIFMYAICMFMYGICKQNRPRPASVDVELIQCTLFCLILCSRVMIYKFDFTPKTS